MFVEDYHSYLKHLGWDKVDQLARVLLDVSGLAISNSQAAKIKECFDQLHEFDKKPLTFKQVAKRPQRGRFARTKSSRSGHIGVMAMKRFVLTYNEKFFQHFLFNPIQVFLVCWIPCCFPS